MTSARLARYVAMVPTGAAVSYALDDPTLWFMTAFYAVILAAGLTYLRRRDGALRGAL